ncbi:hypothetical protein JG688_00016141 [Phytophthora aleatoria]|uniref:Uncharacterized protein n=1 Tax=Phytophthora aleatoria TaxID=2496075 RepID=A0A8J5ISB8_9STRA|nr:hypothetical protein JG688_00016141 [Phytophthora aleatoria]
MSSSGGRHVGLAAQVLPTRRKNCSADKLDRKRTPNDLPPINKSKKPKSFLLHHRLQQSR